MDQIQFQDNVIVLLQQLVGIEQERLDAERAILNALRPRSHAVQRPAQQLLPFTEPAVAPAATPVETPIPKVELGRRDLPPEVQAFLAKPETEASQYKRLQAAGVSVRLLKGRRASVFSNKELFGAVGERAKVLFDFMLTQPGFSVTAGIGGDVLIGAKLWHSQGSAAKSGTGSAGTRAGSALMKLESHGLVVIAPNSKKGDRTFVLNPDLLSKKSKKS